MRGRKRVSSAFGVAIFVVSLLSGGVLASGSQDVSGYLVGERPDPPGTATEVRVVLYLFDIEEIDDARQRFRTDLFMRVDWKDPRLALPEEQWLGRNRSLPLDEIWAPRGLIVNDRGLSPQLPRIADIDDHGNVHYRQRLSGELAVNLEFRTFPFDSQRLPIDIVSYQYAPEELRFSTESAMLGDEAKFSAEGWRLRILEPTIGVFTVPSLGVVRPRLTFLIEAKRNSNYYLLTMVVPMTLIVFMAWTAYWLQPDIVNPRLGISTAAVFSLIALGVTIRLSLPPISYLTRADLFVMGCTALVVLSLGFSVVVIRLASSDRMGSAVRLNRAGRWTYPVLFGGIFLIALAF